MERTLMLISVPTHHVNEHLAFKLAYVYVCSVFFLEVPIQALGSRTGKFIVPPLMYPPIHFAPFPTSELFRSLHFCSYGDTP